MAVMKNFIYCKVDFENLPCPRVGKFEENHPYKFANDLVKIWIFGNCSCSKTRKSNFKTLKNHSSLVFCVIDKSFGTNLEEGLKLIRTKLQEATSKDVGVIDISARNFHNSA